MRALVTGAAGFVGGHLVNYLTSQGHEVAGLESAQPNSGTPLPGSSKIKVFRGDLRDEDTVTKALKVFKPDAVFHLAAQTSVKLSFENPFDTFSVNLIGTLVLLETMSKLGLALKLLLITSSEVYGQLTPEECPVSEDHPLKPVNPYGVSKAAVDLLGYQYFKSYQFPIYIARAFSHSGPGQKTVAVLSDWAFQIAKIDLGISPPVLKVGNMNVKRDYTDVRDVVKAYVAIVEKGKPGEAYNVCSGNGYELRELLEKYRTFTNKEVKVEVDQSRMRPADIPILIGSNRKIRKDTGWEPSTPIDATLKDSFKFWRQRLMREI